jgi:hypothetical protein
MKDVDLKAITEDVTERLSARQNGLRLRVAGDKTYASEVTIYVFVDIEDGGGRNSLDILRLFESVEKQTSDRFQVDVMVLPEPPAIM